MNIKPDFSDKRTLEKYSSAFSMSDMEIFVFPELMFPLVLSNIMSPIIWKWREDPWFKNIHKKSFNYKVNRIKQYIMDHYVFNLDLETWGLTTKEKEINRFSSFINMDLLKQSNALFGYEGDKYYFDIDIRRHFGLDKYTTDIIPYWKTETIDAMTAFKYKESFNNGAGECVSFSTLYAAALFVVGQIPLENIFMIGTPLHSQNFIDVEDGLLTNNRRLVTKKMWFNGTSLSTRARRALENEKVTIVAHISGYIHHMFELATINNAAYQNFSDKLKSFLSTDLSAKVFINFLRFHMDFKKCFQYKHFRHGHYYYVSLETIFEYEHGSKNNFSGDTREALLNDMDAEEFSLTPLENRLIIQDIEEYLEKNNVTDVQTMMEHFVENAKSSNCKNIDNIKSLFNDLSQFLTTYPQLPTGDKSFEYVEPLNININQSREEIMQIIAQKADLNEVAKLTLYVYRQMDKIDWQPFVKAALQRNPVSVEVLKGKSVDQVYQILIALPNESVYDNQRLAQPDEVMNFGRGDGIEKAFVLANYVYNEMSLKDLVLNVCKSEVKLEIDDLLYIFSSSKNLDNKINLSV